MFLPAGVANATPPLLTHLFGPGRPIDAGVRWRGRPILCDHKTWQGLIGGTLAGAATALVQRRIDHRSIPLSFGFAISIGALGGDLVKSFLKRRFGVAPGRTLFPLDQIDYIAGALVGAEAARAPRMPAGTALAYFFLHLVTSAIGFRIGVKDSPL
jgi:CDP-2,3-bis-(O-geranylgeranyl)-sn-glycerol synthase